MGSITDEELAEAYRENAANARKLNAQWRAISTEANQYLGENPLDESA